MVLAHLVAIAFNMYSIRLLGLVQPRSILQLLAGAIS